ncbi:MAG: hypothetical protein RDV41_03485 [Planctomycetota bacterium]|nr:hypothetical protein [Planctomycetota bacterium]
MEKRAFALLLLAYVAACVVFSFLAAGFYQKDEVLHWLISRYAWAHPWLFLDIWGRPLVTFLYAFPARFGVLPARWLSILIGVGVIILTRRIAREMGLKSTIMTAFLTMTQPFFFLLSFCILTELTFALVLAAGMLLLLRKRLILSSLMISLTPLARPEGFPLVFLWACLILAGRKADSRTERLVSVLALAAGTFVWNLCGFIATSDALWLAHSFPWGGETGFYGHGSLLHYVAFLPVITGVAAFPFFVVGMTGMVARRRFQFLFWIFNGIFLVHMLLWTFGLMRSAGYVRYFVSVSPVIALISGYGWERAMDFFRRAEAKPGMAGRLRRLRLSLTAVVVLLATANAVVVAALLQPIEPLPEQVCVGRAAAWHREHCATHRVPQTFCSTPLFFFVSGLDRFDGAKHPVPTRENLSRAEPGSIFIWDSKSSVREDRLTLVTLTEMGWTVRAHFQALEEKYYRVVILER